VNLKKTISAVPKQLVGDQTRTARAKAHLERLESAKGKRLVVDLDASGLDALSKLMEAGYGDSQKAVVIRALVASVARLKKKA
jgi:hypothetical protein